MIDQKTKMLVTTLKKLLQRRAYSNIKRILKKSHTADIAAVLENFSSEEALEIFELEISITKKAEILSHFHSDWQKKIVEALPKQEILKLLQSMDLDDAADFLGFLPEEESKSLLSSMKKEDSKNVVDLMGYPKDSAGGLMDSDVFALNQDLSVSDAIDAIEESKDKKQVYYLYVVNDNQQLIGVVSLKQLLLSKKQDSLKSIMFTNIHSVTLDTSQDDVANIVERYDFLALPVVDSSNKLMGVITVDDVLDVIREETEGEILAMGSAGWEVNPSALKSFKARFPWAFLSFLSGLLCFMILLLFYFIKQKKGFLLSEVDANLWKVMAFLPVFLTLCGITGSQAAVVAVSAIRGGYFKTHHMFFHLKKELFLSLALALTFSGLVYLIGGMVFPEYVRWLLCVALFLQIVLSVMVGNFLPLTLYKWGIDATIVSIPLYTSLINVFSTLILFGFLYSMI